jgi:hypothetical protein
MRAGVAGIQSPWQIILPVNRSALDHPKCRQTNEQHKKCPSPKGTYSHVLLTIYQGVCIKFCYQGI